MRAGLNGSVNENKLFNGIPDDMASNLAMIDELGGTKTYNHYPTGWAMAFNTPFKMWKRYEFNGGTADPCLIAWPSGLGHGGEIRHQYHHAIDIVPTISTARRERAGDDQGTHAEPLRRGEHALLLRRPLGPLGAQDPVLLDARLAGDLARRLEGGHHAHPTISGWSHFNDDVWELYHTDTDRSELHDLAAEHAGKDA